MIKTRRHFSNRETLIFFLPSLLIIVIGFAAAYQFVEPSPPRTITIAAGEPGGAYYKFSNTYKTLLKRQGIELIIRETSGSFENLELLEDNSDGVDLAFIQGGIGRLSDSKNIVSLGSLYYEPLWIFQRSGISLNRITEMKGLKIAVGERGSGTRILAMNLLELNGITEKNSRIISQTSQISADMLINKEVDIAFFVTAHWASHLKNLFASRTVTLMGIDRAQAYRMRFNYLNVIRIPQGVVNFVENIPARDMKLLAPTAQLAAKSQLHPALVDLVLQTARQVHKSGGPLEKQGEFPSPLYLEFDLSEEAHRFYTRPTPFLQRYLPFWVATLLSRAKVMILPFIAIVFPLFKLMPLIYRWRMRSRVYRWYSDLDEVGNRISEPDADFSFSENMAKLNEVEKSVSNIHVPKPYAENLFHLRMHIEMFRKKLKESQKS